MSAAKRTFRERQEWRTGFVMGVAAMLIGDTIARLLGA